MNYWLIKSEPDVFSIQDLKRVKREPWNGVRNYQARNFMWKQMQIGDLALFYHSNAKPPGVVGIAKVTSEAYPDSTQFDPISEYFDEKATHEKPRWWLVDFSFEKEFKKMITLDQLRQEPKISTMILLQKGTRLSITPLEKNHFDFIKKLGS
jgi:predicted RNA-binding protein with PUA-like domain